MDPATKTEQSDDEIWKASIYTDSRSDEGQSTRSAIQDAGVAETVLPGLKGSEDIASSLFESEPGDEEEEFSVRRIRDVIEEAIRRYGSAVLTDLEAFQCNQRNLNLADRERKKQLWMRYHLLQHLHDGVDINEYFASLDMERQRSLAVKSHSLLAGEFPGCLESLETSREDVEEQSTECKVDSKSHNVEDESSSESEYSDAFCVTLDAEDDETSTIKDKEDQHRDTYHSDSPSAQAASFDSHLSSQLLDLVGKEDPALDHDTEQAMEEAKPSYIEGDESIKVNESTSHDDEVDTSYAATKLFEEDHMVPLIPGRHFKTISLVQGERVVYETGLELNSPSLSPFYDKQRDVVEVSETAMLPLQRSTKFTEEGVFSDEPVSLATITGATNLIRANQDSITIAILANVATNFSTPSEVQVHGELPQLDLSLDDDETGNSVDVGSTNAVATTTSYTKQTEEKFDTETTPDAGNVGPLDGDDADLAELDSLKMNPVLNINISSTNKSWLGSFSMRMPQIEQSARKANEQGVCLQEAELAEGSDLELILPGNDDNNLTMKETLDLDDKRFSDYSSATRSLDPINRANGTWIGSFNNRLIQVEPSGESEEELVAKKYHPDDEEFENISDIDNTTNGSEGEEIAVERLPSKPNILTNGTWQGSFKNCTLQVESKGAFVEKGNAFDEISVSEDATTSSNNDEIKYSATTCLLSVEQLDPPVTEEDVFSAPFSNNNSISPVRVASLTRGIVSNNSINMVSMEESNVLPGVMWGQVDTTATTSVDGKVDPQLASVNDPTNEQVIGDEELESSDEHVFNGEAVDTTNRSIIVDDDEVKLNSALSKPPIDCDGSLSVQCTPKSFSDVEVGQMQEIIRECDSEQLATGINDKPNETIAAEDNNLDDPIEATAYVNAELSMETVGDTNERPMDVTNDKVDESTKETIILEPFSGDERPEPIMEVTEITQDIAERFNTEFKEEVSDSNEKQFILMLQADIHYTAAIPSGVNDIDTAQHKSAPQKPGVSVEEASKQPIPESTAETDNAKARITKQYAQHIFKDTPPPDVVSLASAEADGTSSSEGEEENTIRAVFGNDHGEMIMAMDSPKPQKFSVATQTETSKSDPNDSGVMAEMLDCLAKTCFCFRYY